MTFQTVTSLSAFAAAGGTEHPLLDVDFTVFLQLGLFGILFFVTRAYLFVPYLRLRERREQGIDGARAEAQRMATEADVRLADYERKLAAAKAAASEKQRAIRAEAATHERQLMEKARAEAQSTWEKAHTKLGADVKTARTELLAQANDLAKKMAARLLGRNV